ALAELVDLPHHPQVLLKVAQGMKSEKRIVYVKRGTTQKEYLKNVEGAENKRPQMRGAYQRTTSALFEISPRVVKENRKGDLERLRLRYMLPGDFEKEIIPLKKVLDKRVKEEIKNGKRRKVEGRYIFTIDGADAKDFDDAIAVVETQEGFELDVHIADVGFFVPPESLLFSEALRRGNSYYLSGSVIPMLPEILSNEFCSLKPRTTR
ncbi:MAG TPA: RNB domain-containing ribonuclease, partial [Turneriella sp.]|nr:RNB domain-containing ribonuclease [Turneriella sp.]